MFFSIVFGALPLCTFPDTLYHFPRLTVNNRLMDALENRMIFLRVFVAPLVLEGFGVGLEVYHIPHIFAGVEDFVDRASCTNSRGCL